MLDEAGHGLDVFPAGILDEAVNFRGLRGAINAEAFLAVLAENRGKEKHQHEK
ncbi:hypothetical protein ES703_114903 [subsurface metagenome]